MAELTFKSAGVSSREIDLSFPTQTQPTGVPAGVVGTANEGPAFIPITVSNFTEFQQLFGVSDGKNFGPIAVAQWLQKANACTYVRVLGIGDGKKRAATGVVTNAGFVVGDQLPNGTRTVAANRFAVSGGPPGRTHFLGCFMSESNGSTYFTDAGVQSHVSETGAFAKFKVIDNQTTGAIRIADTAGLERIYCFTTGTNGDTITFNASSGSALIVETPGKTAAEVATNLQSAINTAQQGITVSEVSGSITLTQANGALGNGLAVSYFTATTKPDITSDLYTGDIAGFRDTSFQSGSTSGGATPIIRGVLFTPDNVIASLSIKSGSGLTANDITTHTALIDGSSGATYAGHLTGSVDIATSNFTMLLNGHKHTDTYKNIITASFDITSPSYFSKVFNTNPDNFQKAGHLLYTHYDIHPSIAVPTGSGISTEPQERTGVENIAFMLTSSLARSGTPTSTIPDFEDFQDRFKHAVSPYVISQSPVKDLFRFHALSAGAGVNTRYKISIDFLQRIFSKSTICYTTSYLLPITFRFTTYTVV